jgi:hypothetical protein
MIPLLFDIQINSGGERGIRTLDTLFGRMLP